MLVEPSSCDAVHEGQHPRAGLLGRQRAGEGGDVRAVVHQRQPVHVRHPLHELARGALRIVQLLPAHGAGAVDDERHVHRHPVLASGAGGPSPPGRRRPRWGPVCTYAPDSLPSSTSAPSPEVTSGSVSVGSCSPGWRQRVGGVRDGRGLGQPQRQRGEREQSGGGQQQGGAVHAAHLGGGEWRRYRTLSWATASDSGRRVPVPPPLPYRSSGGGGFPGAPALAYRVEEGPRLTSSWTICRSAGSLKGFSSFGLGMVSRNSRALAVKAPPDTKMKRRSSPECVRRTAS